MKRSAYLPLTGILAFLVLLLINLPLSLVLTLADARARGFGWDAAEGTVWNGTIGGASLSGYYIGRIDQRTSFLALLTGRVSSDIRVSGGAANGQGHVILSAGRLRLRDTAVLIDLAGYNIVDAFGAPMRGMLRVETQALGLSADACLEGTASLWTDTMIYTARQYDGDGFPVSGTIRCAEDGRAEIALGGEENGRSVSVEGSIDPSTLNYLAEAEVRGLDPELNDALLLYGFERRGDTLLLVQRGNLLEGQ